MRKDLVSIVVPIYNTEMYLTECINSILSQDYSGDIEIILVDDGSTDRSGEIIDSFADSDDRIKAFHKDNGGLSDARNFGIDKSTGNLICFVDSDDFLDSRYLSVLYELKNKTNAEISECGCYKYNDNQLNKSTKSYNGTKVFDSYSWLTESNLGDFYSVVAWNKLYDRALFDDIRYPVGRVFEDEATTYKIAYKANHIARTYEKLYYYRQRSGSITNQISMDKLNQKIQALDERCSYFHSLNEFDIQAFSEAKYCLMLTAYFKQCNEIYGNDSQEAVFYKDIAFRFNKWIKKSSIVPIKYKAYIKYFLIRNRNSVNNS